MAICYHGDESMHVKVKQQQWKSMVINTDGCHDNIVNNNMYLLTCELLFTQLRTYIRCSHGKVHCYLMLFTLVEIDRQTDRQTDKRQQPYN